MWKRTAVGLGLLLTAGPATAFYFPDWPGAGVKPPPSLIPPEVSFEGNPPSAPPPTQPPTVVVPPTETEEMPPGHAPEPTTLAMAGIGLAAVWGVRRRKK